MLADGIQTLNEDREIMAFLPGANYVFLLIAPGGDPVITFTFAIASSIVGASFYNYLRFLKLSKANESSDEMTESPEESHEHRQTVLPSNLEETCDWSDPREETDEIYVTEDIVTTSLLIIWAGLLFVSMYLLYGFFPKNWILPEVLFFISFGVIALYLTEGILRQLVKEYES